MSELRLEGGGDLTVLILRPGLSLKSPIRWEGELILGACAVSGGRLRAERG